jgi:hypothetical protein
MLKTANAFALLENEREIETPVWRVESSSESVNESKSKKRSKGRSKKSRSEPRETVSIPVQRPILEVRKIDPADRKILCTYRGRHVYEMEKTRCVSPVEGVVVPIHSIMGSRPNTVVEDHEPIMEDDWDCEYSPIYIDESESEDDFEDDKKHRGRWGYM